MSSFVAVVAGGPMVEGMSDAPEGCEIAYGSPSMSSEFDGAAVAALPFDTEVVDDRRCMAEGKDGKRCRGWKNQGTDFCAGHNRSRKAV